MYIYIYIYICIFIASLEHEGLIVFLDYARNRPYPNFCFMTSNCTVFAVGAEHYKIADTLVYRLVTDARKSENNVIYT